MTAKDTQHSSNLIWEQEAPFSSRFEDIYFNMENGVKEKHHVFIEGCNIKEIFQKHQRPVICELGFGTGLNTLLTFQLWAEHHQQSPSKGYLHYLSVEGFPLSHNELAKALSPFSAHLKLLDDLLSVYPKPTPRMGFHRIWLKDHPICLTLLIGNVKDVLLELNATAHAWFLDGFTPKKNPDMWSPEVCAQIARLSQVGTRISSFTAAGDVRRSLQDVGFQVERTPGYAQKRHMICGVMTDPSPAPTGETASPYLRDVPPYTGHEVLRIAGTGIAGASVAYALRKRGVKAALYETKPTIASGTSGNAAAMVKLRPSLLPTSLFFQSAFSYAHHIYSQWPDAAQWSGCIELATTEQKHLRHQKFLKAEHILDTDLQVLCEDDVQTVSGWNVRASGIYLPEGGWIYPQKIIHALIKDTPVLLEQSAQTPHIICAGHQSWHYPEVVGLSMRRSLGQLTLVRAPSAIGTMPLSFSRYALPLTEDTLLLGASYDRTESDIPAPPTMEADNANIDALKAILPDVQITKILSHRTAIRATTPDHLPYAGALPHIQKTIEILASPTPLPLPYQDMWILTGLGSHGFTTAPLLAELVVSQLLGDPWPMPLSDVQKVAPLRKILTAKKRAQRRPSPFKKSS